MAPQSRRSRNEHHGSFDGQWTLQGHREWVRALATAQGDSLFTRRSPRPRRHGSPSGRRRRLRLYDRRPPRPTLRCQARPGHARQENRLPRLGLPHRRRPRAKPSRKTWDHFLLPAPFARAVILFAPPIYVPSDANAEVLESKHSEMQSELERVRDIAESWFSLNESDRQNFRAEFSK